MKLKNRHRWDVTYAQARDLQVQLAAQVRQTRIRKKIRTVCGLDCAFTKDARNAIAAAIVLNIADMSVLESQQALEPVPMPYIPGLLSFREAPACLAAVKKLNIEPDCFMIDGQGIAHPRRMGIAAHLGLFFDKPTVGCAKSRLIGTYKEPPKTKGSFEYLYDPKTEDIIGAVLRTRTNVKPLFVSVGHRCTLDDTINIVLTCAVKYRLPEPTRLAHQHVTKLKTTDFTD